MTMRGFVLGTLGAVGWAGLLSCSAIFVDSPRGEPPQYCTAFNHFPKSGGSTIKGQLIGNSKVERSRMPGLITGMVRTTPESRLDIIHNSSVIMGYVEMLRLPLEDAGRECEYFTMVRHPIDRLVSAFYFCPTDKAIPENRPAKWCGGSEGQTEPLQDRLLEFSREKWGNTAFRLMMNSFVCDPRFELCKPEFKRDPRSWPHNINTPEGSQMMENVKFILATYTAVGILEEWELSMELFNAKVKSPVREWNASFAANQAVHSPERQALLEWAYQNEELSTRLAADMLFYEYALAIFRQQTTATLGIIWD